MSQLFETICLIDGLAQNLKYHQLRMSRSMKGFFQLNEVHDILQNLEIPEKFQQGKVKLKIIYSHNSFQQIYSHYSIKAIKSYRLVHDEDIEYAFKYFDRSRINQLCEGLKEGEDIIIVKNGYLTDASYANLIFKDDKGELFTSEHSLLKGTKQSKYLDEKLIRSIAISQEDIKKYKFVTRINAMMDLGEDNWVPVEEIEL